MDLKLKKLITSAAALEIEMSLSQAKQLIAYMDKLLEINKKINLTRIVNEDDFIKLHLLDSLTLLKRIKNPKAKILDLGTGGGFPGIPLAIILEEAEITLLDATLKKLKVVESLAKEVGIHKIKILHGRAEVLGQDKAYREKYEVVVSRAVANLTLLAEYALPLVKVKGSFLAMKGKDYEKELLAAKKPMALLGGEIKGVYPCLLLKDEGVHVIIDIKKQMKTPDLYPRMNGKIKKEGFPIEAKNKLL